MFICRLAAQSLALMTHCVVDDSVRAVGGSVHMGRGMRRPSATTLMHMIIFKMIQTTCLDCSVKALVDMLMIFEDGAQKSSHRGGTNNTHFFDVAAA